MDEYVEVVPSAVPAIEELLAERASLLAKNEAASLCSALQGAGEPGRRLGVTW